jgi:hypothetical protein
MSPVATTAAFVVGAVAGGVLCLTVLLVSARRRRAGLTFFRCRVGPPTGRRTRRARWAVRRTSAAWVDDVLLVRSGALRLWLTPVSASAALDVSVRSVPPDEARGLGPHPFALRLTNATGDRFEIAAPAESAELLVGPYLVAHLADRTRAEHERGG